MFPGVRQVVKRDDWIFAKDGAPSHRSNLVQDFLKETLKRRFINASEWPASPDTNPLDYFFCNSVKSKVYEGRLGKPFSDENELQNKIRAVWEVCATNTKEIRKAIKQFVPRLRAVEQKRGYSIKMLFG